MLRARSMISAARLFAGFLSPRSSLGRGWDEALSIAQTGRFTVVSLDCFGTLLARESVDWEQRILAETVGREAGYSESRSRQFLKAARVKAQHLAGGDEEPTAESIWTEYCAVLGIPDLAKQISAHELKLLEMTSSATSDALKFVAAVENLELPWIVCSDTRWPAQALSGLLGGKGFAVPQESIFCSCDHRRSKFRGGLYSIAYQHLAETLGQRILPADILHIGDNFFADKCSAAHFGMRVVKVPSAQRDRGQTAEMDSANAYLERVRQDIALGVR